MAACDIRKPEFRDNIPITYIEEGLSQTLNQSLTRDTPTLQQNGTFCDTGHAESTLKNIFRYFQAGSLTDVTLIVDDCRIPAHKVLLASCSRYFAAMFTGSLKEARLTEITLLGVDAKALQELVLYCYTGCIELKEETVETLISTAIVLQMNVVANACWVYLEKRLNPSNCLGRAVFAEKNYCMKLHKAALNYAYQHFTQVVKHPEYLALQVDEVAALLKLDDLNVVTEENVFESLMAWVKHDIANREQHLPTLLKLVKLNLLPPQYLIDNVERECTNVPECQLLIIGTMKRHLLPERYNSPKRTRLSHSNGYLLAIGGVSSDYYKGPMNMEIYSAKSDSWCHLKAGKTAARRWFGGTVLQNRLIVVGGMDNENPSLNTVVSTELTKTMDGNWSMLAPMNKRRVGLGVVTLVDGPNACIYAVGGHEGLRGLNSVERWDASLDTWTFVASMAEVRWRHGVAVLGGRVYAVGGSNGRESLQSVECYDPKTDHWSNCAPMTCKRSAVSVCADGSYLYALGGREKTTSLLLASVERYDPVANTWVLLAQLSCARSGITSCLLNDRIVAMGGTGNDTQHVVEVYDAESNCWRALAPLTIPRYGGSLVYVPPPDASLTAPSDASLTAPSYASLTALSDASVTDSST